MGVWWSGQSQQTVNLSAVCLRRFESCRPHKLKTTMTESDLENFIKKETDEMRKEREKNDYRNQEPFRTNRMLEENGNLIKEKGLEIGRKVRLILLEIEGEIIEIRENERNSVVVKREDGETFAYSPREMEPFDK